MPRFTKIAEQMVQETNHAISHRHVPRVVRSQRERAEALGNIQRQTVLAVVKEDDPQSPQSAQLKIRLVERLGDLQGATPSGRELRIAPAREDEGCAQGAKKAQLIGGFQRPEATIERHRLFDPDAALL